ncbi:MAG: ribulose-phosphate 3-epimerase [Gemmatimonadales bacterium]
MTVRIAASVLNADLSRFRDEVEAAAAGGAEWIHVDVMDGHFVPTISFGAPVIRAIRRITDLPIDAHLMVEHPEQYLDEFADAGATGFTFHPEATVHIQRHLAEARRRGMRAGLALNPATPPAVLLEVAGDLDLVLVMTVNPGYGGQTYLPAATAKIQRVREMMNELNIRAALEVDGGITVQTIAEAHAAGADTFVAGMAVFGQPDPAEAVRALKRACLVRV